MADRFCKDCGQELWSEDRFCAGCGRPLHSTAHVPTPEAEVPASPPSPPPQEALAPSPTPEADVPVLPPSHPAEGSPQTAGSEAPPAEDAPLVEEVPLVEEAPLVKEAPVVEVAPPADEAPPAPPSQSQAQQSPVGRWQLIRQPILWFFGSLVVTSLQGAFFDALPGGFVNEILVQMISRLIIFVPLWLFSGGFLYLIVRLLGRKLSILQVIFNRYLTMLIVILVLASAVLNHL